MHFNAQTTTMPNRPSLLDELRTQYETVRQSTHEHADVESFQAIDARLRKTFRWLEKAITYLDGLKPSIEHRSIWVTVSSSKRRGSGTVPSARPSGASSGFR